MTKKSVSFDAMVRFFMKHYKIPTQKDVDKLMAKLDRLETMVSKSDTEANIRKPGSQRSGLQPVRPGMTASDTVLEVIRETGDKGIGFAEVQDRTGFNEKKIRNIIFRLNNLGRIKRIDRGIYMAN